MAVKSVLRTFLLVNVALMASAAVLPRAGTQFITGACTADADCASSCCGFKSGKCAAAVVAQERDGGCGFGDVAPNNIATIALGSSAAAAGVDNSKAGIRASGAAAAAPAPAASPAAAAAAPAAPATGSGKAPGTQFITGDCANDGECASTCCSAGKCAARLVATGPGGKGCGFGGAAAAAPAAPAAAPAAAASPAAAAAAPAAPATGSGKAPGTQFITGDCANDGECASTCCSVGKCAARLVATGPGGKGCGFGGAAAAAPAASPAAAAAPAASPAAASTGSGKAPGAQFITGPCANDGECASACCGFKSGKCAAPIVAQERDGGCGFGNATPNADALKKVQRRMLAAAAARLD